uniref:Phospholipase-like protein n=1 Tax=Tanacetum cinerariifolium TaxID=118510 RepID=A0A6L2NGY7_TANCI|nr:phospholipase-like protein [Tanacetum cinerariifolium]
MSDFNELYDVKVCVRSSVKLLPEIKLLLQTNPTRERIFKRTVFGPWLDISSHENDNHQMHYVLQHHVYVSRVPSDAPSVIFHISDHWLQFCRKEFCLITCFRFGIVLEKHKKLSPFGQRVFPEKVTKTSVKKLKSSELLKLLRDKKGWLALFDMDAVRVCLLIVIELVFMGKEDRNCIPRHIVSLVEDLDAWNDYSWSEYHEIWWSKKDNVLPRDLAWTNISKFEKSDYNCLFGLVLISNVNLYSTPAKIKEPWFIASISFINGLVNEDKNVFLDDCVGVSKDNDVDGQHQLGYVTERPIDVSIVELFVKVRALRQGVVLIKVDDERIANVERLLKEKLQNDFATEKTKPDMIPNHSEDI